MSGDDWQVEAGLNSPTVHVRIVVSAPINRREDMNQETKDRITDEEQAYFDRRLEELSAGQHWKRSDLHHKINQELDDIRRNRNAD